MTIDEQIEAVREAIASGALEVRIRQNGVEKFVKYESFTKLQQRLDWLLGQQAVALGTAPRKNVIRAAFSRG